MGSHMSSTKSRIYSVLAFLGILMMGESNLQSYVLQTNEAARKALSIQQEAFKDYSLSLLKKADLRPGDTAWDIGCGNGEMTSVLAELVGPSGTIYALDQSPEQLNATKKRLTQEGHKNIVYVQVDLESWYPQPNSADLVFSRFIFMHLKNPGLVVEKVTTLLKPGGRFIVQEPTWKERKTIPDLPLLKDYGNKAVKALNDLGVDTEYGNKVSTIGSKNSLELLHTDSKSATYNRDTFAELVNIRLNELKPRMIKAKVATEKDFEVWSELPDLIKKQGNDFIGQVGMLHGAVYKKT